MLSYSSVLSLVLLRAGQAKTAASGSRKRPTVRQHGKGKTEGGLDTTAQHGSRRVAGGGVEVSLLPSQSASTPESGTGGVHNVAPRPCFLPARKHRRVRRRSVHVLFLPECFFFFLFFFFLFFFFFFTFVPVKTILKNWFTTLNILITSVFSLWLSTAGVMDFWFFSWFYVVVFYVGVCFILIWPARSAGH